MRFCPNSCILGFAETFAGAFVKKFWQLDPGFDKAFLAANRSPGRPGFRGNPADQWDPRACRENAFLLKKNSL
jgi:hypothetical protein